MTISRISVQSVSFPPEAQCIDNVYGALAEAKAQASCQAVLFDASGGLGQLLPVQPAQLLLQAEGCDGARIVHSLCCCLIGSIKQLACLQCIQLAIIKYCWLSR